MRFLKSNKINELKCNPNLVFAPFRYLAKVLIALRCNCSIPHVRNNHKIRGGRSPRFVLRGVNGIWMPGVSPLKNSGEWLLQLSSCSVPRSSGARLQAGVYGENVEDHTLAAVSVAKINQCGPAAAHEREPDVLRLREATHKAPRYSTTICPSCAHSHSTSSRRLSMSWLI